MYQANEIGARRGRRHGLPERPENVPRRATQQNETGRPVPRLRVVRAPGGFAFVADETVAGKSG